MTGGARPSVRGGRRKEKRKRKKAGWAEWAGKREKEEKNAGRRGKWKGKWAGGPVSKENEEKGKVKEKDYFHWPEIEINA